MAVVIPDPESETGADLPESPDAMLKFSTEVPEAVFKSLNVPRLMGMQNITKGLSIPNLTGMDSVAKSLNISKLMGLNIAGPIPPSLVAGSALAASLSPITEAMGKGFAASILGDLGKSNLLGITRGMDSLFSGLIPTLDFLKGLDLDLTRGPWPANLEHLVWDQEILYRLTVEEGLPIAWVPRAETTKLIFEADTPGKRRAVYGRRWRGITEDCRELAGKMDSSWLAPYMGFLHEVIDTMRDGHYMAAQALAANTLDTVAFYLAHSTWKEAKDPARVDDPGKLPIRTFFVWAQLAGVYKRYFRENDDPIPATFNRHGASHGVSRRQYSRLNATLGMAHLTSLMWIIDSETRRPKKRNKRTP